MSHGDWIQAESNLKILLQSNPFHPEYLHLLGIACLSQNRIDEGINHIINAISRAPRPHFYINLGRGYMQKKNWKEAIQQFKLAVGLSPGNPEARFHLALAHKSISNFKQAQSEYRKTLKLKPDHPGASYNLGNLFMETGKFREAIDQFQQCIKYHPGHFNAHNNLGSVYEKIDDFNNAETHYRKSIKIRDKNPEALRNLSSLLNKTGQYNRAKEVYERLLKLPNHSTTWHQLHSVAMLPKVFNDQSEYENLIKTYQSFHKTIAEQHPKIQPDHFRLLAIYPSTLLTYSHLNLRDLKERYGNLYDQYLRSMSDQLKVNWKNKKKSSEKTKVGFVVTSGHEGVFLKCMKGMVNELDKNLLDKWVIGTAPLGPAIIKEGLDNTEINFLPISHDLLQSARIIAKECFDVLYYWEIGTDNMNYFLPHFRLAERQATSWGWPITSGIPNVDHYLSCELLESENAVDHYTENLVLLKKIPSFYYHPTLPSDKGSRGDFNLPDHLKIYLCTQNVRKIHPGMDKVFTGILKKDPNAHFVFTGDKFETIDDQLRSRLMVMMPEGQFTILKRLKTERYFQLLTTADVILDTFPYTGGANTCADALATGTPYVTMEGEFHRNRFGSAVYRQIGITDLIASDSQEYIHLACKTANDKAFRHDISASIESNKHKFFEDREAVEEFQSFLLSKATQDSPKVKVEIPDVLPTKTEEKYKRASDHLKSKEYDRAIEIINSIEDPLFEDLILLSKAYRIKGDEDSAIATFKMVIEKYPDEPYPYKFLGSILEKNGSSKDALLLYQKAMDQELNNIPVELQFRTCMPAVFESQEEVELVTNNITYYLEKHHTDVNYITSEEWLESTLLVLRYMLFHEVDRCKWKEWIAEIVGKNIPVRNGKRKNKQKPRIGFLVTRGHEKIFTRSNKGLLKAINKEKYEILIISPASTYEWIHAEVNDQNIKYITLHDSLSKSILDITLADLDVLYYWEVGTDSNNYILPFYRMASIQVTSWGVHCTSGIKNMDYFISSRLLEPVDGHDHYSEQLVLFNSLPTYYYKPTFEPKKIDLKRWGITENHHIYFCNQTLLKIQPKMDEIIKGILCHDENAIILLINSMHPPITDSVKSRFNKNLGDLKDRIVFIPYFRYNRYMSFLSHTHVVIDTLDFSGANTSYEAFSLGKPIITMEGKYSNSRFTSALYKKMGLENMIVHNVQDYINLAVKTGTDVAYRKSIIEKINSNSHTLWEEKKYIEEFEAFIDKALEDL